MDASSWEEPFPKYRTAQKIHVADWGRALSFKLQRLCCFIDRTVKAEWKVFSLHGLITGA